MFSVYAGAPQTRRLPVEHFYNLGCCWTVASAQTLTRKSAGDPEEEPEEELEEDPEEDPEEEPEEEPEERVNFNTGSSSLLASSPAPAVCRCDSRVEELQELLQEPRGDKRQTLVLHQQSQRTVGVLPSASVWGDQRSARCGLLPTLLLVLDAPPRSKPSLFVSGKHGVSGSPADAARPPPPHRVLPSLLHVRHHHRPVHPGGIRPLHHRHPRLPQTEEAVEEPEEVGHTCPS